MTPINLAIDLKAWIAEHSDEFTPPVANKVIWEDSDFIAMVIRGPNARRDFHIDPYDEIFIQVVGDIVVEIIDESGHRQRRLLGEGDIMLVPGGTPHSPLRPADTWGLVIERPRGPGEIDELAWFCSSCGNELHRAQLQVEDIGTQLAEVIDGYHADEARRTCSRCGTLQPVPGPFEL